MHQTSAIQVNTGQSDANLKLREAIILAESKNFTNINLLVILGTFLIANVTTILRGGSGVKSLLGLDKCSAWSWVVFAVYVGISFAMAAVGSRYVLKKQAHKEVVGPKYPRDVNWSYGKILYGWTYVTVIGAASSIAGLGGGSIMTPFMFRSGVQPRSASATALMLIFISRIVVTIINLFSGVLLADYLFFIGSLTLVGAFIADKTSGRIQSRLKRQSFIAMIFVMVTSCCAVLFVFSSIKNINSAKDTGKSFVAFPPYCT